MFEPQDLPGRYGRVVKALDQALIACQCEAVVGGGWAVWRHGYLGRVTQDIDIALPSNRIDDFLHTAAVSGFDVLNTPTGNWPKLLHRETGIEVDILPEGGRPGTAKHPAPTTISHPQVMGATPGMLTYISLPALIELKLAAGRLRDEADVVELIRENPDSVEEIAAHLAAVHPDYGRRFAELVERSEE
ncbi:nucleotidyl transferase AbiEii/AbiGii toxin family protein [Bythopirellula goksoeyrii]|nr:nucleotidyl transferase AbiEii/AbiGii toxin family protein [Bythopirellula goksoeyrii]